MEADASSSSDDGTVSAPCHIRVDAGVVPGTIVSPHYDPILSKIIAYSPHSRMHAIRGLGSALDQYLLRGVQNNVPFVRDLLRHEEFRKGHTPTGFIARHYPEGFSGGRLSEKEKKELAVIANEIGKRRGKMMGLPPLPLSSGAGESEVVVCLGGMFGDAYLVRTEVNVETDGSIIASVTKFPDNRGGKEVHDENMNAEGESNVVVTDEALIVELSAMEYEIAGNLATVKVAGENRALQVRSHDSLACLFLLPELFSFAFISRASSHPSIASFFIRRLRFLPRTS